MVHEVAVLAREQQHLLTRSQALAAGLSRASLEHRLRPGGPWQAILPSVYATFTGELTMQQRWIAGLLYGGPACLLGGTTAAALHGLHRLPTSRLVRLLLPHPIRRSDQAFVRIRRTMCMPRPSIFDELRAVPVERAVVDACRDLTGLDSVRALVAESIQRRKTSVAALSAELARGGSGGSRVTRQVLIEVADGARSVAEATARDLVLRSTLPRPGWNRDLFTRDGEWLACVDAWWREAGVVLEIDSREWHLLPEHWEATMARHARMTSYGLLVVHAAPRQFRTQPADFLGTLDRTIAQGLARPTPPVTDIPPYGWRPFS